MDSNNKHYFDIHPNVNEFFFTADGLAFFTEANANNHANGLKEKKVTRVTRDEANAWWKTAAPEQLAAAEKELTDATEVKKKAQEAVDGLPAKTPATKRAPYMKALNDATARVAAAQLAVDEAKEKAEAV